MGVHLDDFVTPSSTPPNEPDTNELDDVTPSMTRDQTQTENLSELVKAMSEENVRDKIYDKYTLVLRDLQVVKQPPDYCATSTFFRIHVENMVICAIHVNLRF